MAVEYSTEEKRELYDLEGDLDTEDGPTGEAATGDVLTLVFRELFDT